MIWPLLAMLAVGSGSADPRIEIVAAQLAGDPHKALAITERLLEADPDRGRGMGLDYLRGDLLEQLGRSREADRAFAAAMSSIPRLAAYGRYRLALNQNRSGHPEVAAGLLATLLATSPPRDLVEPATRLFADALARGGDCRLLTRMNAWNLSGVSRRLMEISSVDCSLSTATPEESMRRLMQLLEETVVDEPARLAAERLHRHFGPQLKKRRDLLLVGETFHHQRIFELAVAYLERGLAAASPLGEKAAVAIDGRYALARSYFWQAKYLDAVREFGRVAATASRSEDIAGALYQQGRSYELYGSWLAAANSFQQAYLEDTAGRWAAPALLSTLRLEWRHGREQEALTILEILRSRPSWSALHGRAALFLASSDLAQGRSDRAEGWLSEVSRAGRSLTTLVRFWDGRLEEQRGNADRATSFYLEVIATEPFHPLAQFARERLAHEQLASTARALGERLATESNARSLFRAWILLGEDKKGQEAFERARERFRRSRSAEPFLSPAFIAPASWPLWHSSLQGTADLLAALGLWQEGEAAAIRYFPASDVSLAYTGSRLLASAGAHRSALRHAETLYEGAIARLPAPLVPVPLRRAAFPLPYGALIASSALRHHVDPYLLTALIREESRFDPEAVSLASARGLTQIVLPTAKRLARRAGFESIVAEDLHRPEVAIALGAAYLEDLSRRFDGREIEIVAAYNAGEQQAEIWKGYCFSDDPDEFFTKVGFPETREYLERVLNSRAQYADLYPDETFTAP